MRYIVRVGTQYTRWPESFGEPEIGDGHVYGCEVTEDEYEAVREFSHMTQRERVEVIRLGLIAKAGPDSFEVDL